MPQAVARHAEWHEIPDEARRLLQAAWDAGWRTETTYAESVAVIGENNRTIRSIATRLWRNRQTASALFVQIHDEVYEFITAHHREDTASLVARTCETIEQLIRVLTAPAEPPASDKTP
jgi:replication-associated recombination protein RarA